jgi:hypothetical protein
MDGVSAQALAFTIVGNRYLHDADIGHFWPAAAVFEFYKRVRFSTVTEWRDGAPIGESYAADPLQWFVRLAADGVVGLRLHWFSSETKDIRDWETAGFAGGGGRRLIEAVKATASDYWEAQHLVADPSDSERKIWAATYWQAGTDYQTPDLPVPSLGALKAELNDTLREIHAYALKEKLSPFAQLFVEARELLNGSAPLDYPGYFQSLQQFVPELAARQLIGAAGRAWVFGGMGSWNDLGRRGDEAYDALSERLWWALVNGVTGAANATFDPHPALRK